MLDKLLKKQDELYERLDVLEGCEDNPVYRKEIQEIRKELSEIQEYIKTELFQFGLGLHKENTIWTE